MASNAYSQAVEQSSEGQHISPCDSKNTSNSERTPSTESVTTPRVAEKDQEHESGEHSPHDDHAVIETRGNSENESGNVIDTSNSERTPSTESVTTSRVAEKDQEHDSGEHSPHDDHAFIETRDNSENESGNVIDTSNSERTPSTESVTTPRVAEKDQEHDSGEHSPHDDHAVIEARDNSENESGNVIDTSNSERTPSTESVTTSRVAEKDQEHDSGEHSPHDDHAVKETHDNCENESENVIDTSKSERTPSTESVTTSRVAEKDQEHDSGEHSPHDDHAVIETRDNSENESGNVIDTSNSERTPSTESVTTSRVAEKDQEHDSGEHSPHDDHAVIETRDNSENESGTVIDTSNSERTPSTESVTTSRVAEKDQEHDSGEHSPHDDHAVIETRDNSENESGTVIDTSNSERTPSTESVTTSRVAEKDQEHESGEHSPHDDHAVIETRDNSENESGNVIDTSNSERTPSTESVTTSRVAEKDQEHDSGEHSPHDDHAVIETRDNSENESGNVIDTSNSERTPSTESVTTSRVAEKDQEHDSGEHSPHDDHAVIETRDNSENESGNVIDTSNSKRTPSTNSVTTSRVEEKDQDHDIETHETCGIQPGYIIHELLWFSMNLLFPLSSIVLFFVDVVSDILLAREYYNDGMMWEFGLTAVFVIVPAIIICVFVLYYKNRFQSHPPVRRVLFLIMTFSMMSPVISQLEYIYYRIKNRNKSSSEEPGNEESVEIMHDKYRSACILSMLECFLEAAPQLTIQVYILLQHRNDKTLLTEVIRAVAIFSSWISMSWCLVAFEKSYYLTENTSLTIPGMVFYFLWRATEMGTRIIAIGLFAAQFSYYVAIIVGGHWLLMLLWMSYDHRTDLRQSTCSSLLVILIISCPMVFCFVNYFNGRIRYKMMFYYIVVYMENCLMIGLWFHFTDHKGAWFHIPALLIVVFGIFVQLIFQLTFFRWFHPMGPKHGSCCSPCQACKCFWCPPHGVNENDDAQMSNDQTLTTAV